MNYTTREKKPFILWTHMIIHYFCLIFFRFDKSSTDIKLLVSMNFIQKNYISYFRFCEEICCLFSKDYIFYEYIVRFFSILIFTLKTQYENTC